MKSATAVGLLLACLAAACGGGGAAPGTDPPDPPDPTLGVELRLDTDPPGAALSVYPRIARAGRRLYVTWYDRRSGDTDVYFNRSLDGGRTWGRSDRRLDTDPPGAASSSIPAIAAAGDRVYVAWQDARGQLSEVRLNRSLDAGSTWLAADVRLDRPDGREGSSVDADVACVGDDVWVVWSDNRDGEPDIRLNRSADAGATWLARDVRLDTDLPGAAASLAPRIAADGATVIVAWQDARAGAFDVRANVSFDGGATWLAADLRLDTDVPGASDSRAPRVALQGSQALVAWQDHRNGEPDIYANASADAGRTWQLADVRLDRDVPGAAASLRPTLAMDGPLAVVAWEDERSGLPDVYACVSDDFGATWSLADVRLDTDGPGVARSLTPSAAVDGPHVYVAFADDRAGSFDLLLQASVDAGQTWRTKEVRLDAGTVAGVSHALAPQVVAGEGEAVVVFFDERDGPGDIYANRQRADP